MFGDEIADDLEAVVKDRNQNHVTARGPDSPTSRQRKEAAFKKRLQEQEIDPNEKLPQTPGVKSIEEEAGLRNPRLAKGKVDAILDRRRKAIWNNRQRAGAQVRRPILDRDGKETGGTTSSLE